MKRWGVAILGNESGHVTPITFIRFHRKGKAMDEARRLNNRMPTSSHGDSLVRYVVFDYRLRKVVNDGG